jgi:hypothetical protein
VQREELVSKEDTRPAKQKVLQRKIQHKKYNSSLSMLEDEIF